jgi:hypothetical protein
MGAHQQCLMAAKIAASSGASFTDDFNRASLGANWTVDAGTCVITGSTDFEGQSGSYANNFARYTATQITTTSGYIYAGTTGRGNASRDTFYLIPFRYTDATSAMYVVVIDPVGGAVEWWHYTAATGGTETLIATTATTVSYGDTWGITWTGTGTSTEVRVWRNPAGTTASAVGTFAGSSSPTVTFTTNPASPVNSGNYVGLGTYFNSDGNGRFDSFGAGEL